MTVPSTARRAGPFDGTGSQTAFPFSFRVFSAADIKVTLADEDGIETVQTLTTHYTVSVNSNQDTSPGGTVTMLTAPAVDTVLVITGATPYTQTLDLPAGGSYSPAALENALDRIVFQVQQLAEALGRSITLPATSAGASVTLPAVEEDAILGWSATSLRNFTAAELATLLSIAEGTKLALIATCMDLGANGNGTGNDQASIQSLIDTLSAAGGGKLRGLGKTYRLAAPLIIKDGVELDLEGGKLLSALSGSTDCGVRLRNYSQIRNGEIEVQSSGSPGSQGGIHAPIMIGPLYGEGGTVASPSVDEGVKGWVVQNMVLHTNAVGKVGIQVIGGANNGLIDGVEFPGNSAMAGAVHLDWGFVGTIASGDVAGSRANFDAGTAYTTHPSNILIRRVKIGALTRAKTGPDIGSHGVRISGCHNIRVEGLAAVQTTYAFIRVHAGDLGYEFAPSSVKNLRMKGIVIDGAVCLSTTDSWAVYVDSYADNIQAAVGGGYTPLLDPVHETDIEVKHVTAKGSGSGTVTPGMWLIQCRGGRFTDLDLSGYAHGVRVDEKVYGAQIHGRFWGNRGHGVYVDHGTTPPEDVQILPNTECYQNGQDGGFSNPAGIAIGKVNRIRVDGALLGHRTAASETTQTIGLRVIDNAATEVEVVNNHVFSVKSGGTGYSLLSSTDYGVIRLFDGNTAASAISTKIAGVNILPIRRGLCTDGTERAEYRAQRVVLSADTTPTAGTWPTGAVIWHDNPTGSNTGTRCTTGGSPGTWGQF